MSVGSVLVKEKIVRACNHGRLAVEMLMLVSRGRGHVFV